MDYLIQYLESSGIAFCPYTPAETELFLFIWSRVFLNKKDTEALLESQGLFEQFGKYNPKQITGQSALEEFGEQIKPCQLFTTNISIGILCQTIPPPQDLQKFCLENGRKPNAPA